MRVGGLLLAVVLAACSDDKPAPPVKPPPVKQPPVKPPPSEVVTRPRRVRWDHILITFEGSYDRVKVFRSREEAKKLAYKLRDRIEAGVSFDALKREYSDDRNQEADVALGPYVMVDGIRRVGTELDRSKYHKVIADIVFGLGVGEVAIADYDAKGCPLGWHVITVLERE